jgi:Fatty acid desaturase
LQQANAADTMLSGIGRIPHRRIFGMIHKRLGRRGLRAVEWPTVGLIISCYTAWIVVGLMVWPSYPIVALIVLGFIVALQSSLMHEVLHGHPTRNGLVNEASVFLPIGIVWPYRRFKALHLRHHADERLTDPFDDPESFYQALWMHEELPPTMKALLKVNNTMVGRFILGPWLSIAGFFLGDIKLMREGDRAVRLAWALHAAGLAVVGASGRPHDHRRALAALVPVPQQQPAFCPSPQPDGRLVQAAAAVPRASRRVGADEQWLRRAELSCLAQRVRVQGEGAGRAPVSATRAGARRDLSAARARPQCRWARHRAGAGGAAQELASCQRFAFGITRRHELHRRFADV